MPTKEAKLQKIIELAKDIWGEQKWCREHIKDKCKEYESDHIHQGWQYYLRESIK